MNSVQESKNELDAAIRYAENAISSAKQTIESMEFRQEMAQKNYQEQTGREEALAKQVQELEERNDGLNAQVADLNVEVQKLEAKVQGQYDDIKQLERDLTVKTSQAEAWKKEARELNERNDSLSATIQRLKQDQPTMPVIPKDVAIAIFREGQRRGYNAESVTDSLKGLCERKEFECRIHGVDDEAKDSASA